MLELNGEKENKRAKEKSMQVCIYKYHLISLSFRLHCQSSARSSFVYVVDALNEVCVTRIANDIATDNRSDIVHSSKHV